MRADHTCPECGAPVPEGGTCQDNFHALLFLEAEVVGGSGKVAHFYAVASYVLQHPRSMGYTVGTLEGLRSSVADVLEGRAGIPEIRQRSRSASMAAGRVTRRGDEPVPVWPVTSWPMVVTDVLPGGPSGYCESVEAWARAVVSATEGLSAHGAAEGGGVDDGR